LELVVCNPAFVLGPPLSSRTDSTSIKTIKNFMEGNIKEVQNGASLKFEFIPALTLANAVSPFVSLNNVCTICIMLVLYNFLYHCAYGFTAFQQWNGCFLPRLSKHSNSGLRLIPRPLRYLIPNPRRLVHLLFQILDHNHVASFSIF